MINVYKEFVFDTDISIWNAIRRKELHIHCSKAFIIPVRNVKTMIVRQVEVMIPNELNKDDINHE